MDMQAIQHYLLKIYSFFHYISKTLFLKINQVSI